MSDAFAAWLIAGGVGPALASIPVNVAADAGIGAAQRLFRRLRRADDLSRLVKAATGTAVDLTKDEFEAVRHLLGDSATWQALGRGTDEDLVHLIATCLPPRAGRTSEDSRAAALVIARGLLEFAVADVDRELFQQLLLARLQRMQADQAGALDRALFDLQADLVTGFASVMDRLPPGPANRVGIMAYLAKLIDWLNTDPWPQDERFRASPLTPTGIERKLRVTTAGPDGERDVDASTGLLVMCPFFSAHSYSSRNAASSRCHLLPLIRRPGCSRRRRQDSQSSRSSGSASCQYLPRCHKNEKNNR